MNCLGSLNENRGFTLIEIILVTLLLLILSSAIIFNISNLNDKYDESVFALKSYLTYHKYKSMIDQKNHSISFDGTNFSSSLIGYEDNIEYITNGLTIIYMFPTNCIFRSDGNVDDVKIGISNGNHNEELTINSLGVIKVNTITNESTPEQ